MRFELIDGDTVLMGILANDGWTLVNTFSNPYPQPWFFALMQLNKTSYVYDMEKAKKSAEEIHKERAPKPDEIPF